MNRFIAYLMSLTLAAAVWGAPSSNTLGFREYKKGHYEEAIALFQQAVQEDPSSAVAHYNLACAKALVARTSSCRYDEDDIIVSLLTAIRLDPSRKRKAIVDPDLKDFHRLAVFRLWSGTSFQTDAQLQQILPQLSWHGSCMGMKCSSIQFFSDGRVFWDHDRLPAVSRGTYRVEAGRIVINAASETVYLQFEFRPASDTPFANITKDGTVLFDEIADNCNA